MTIEELDALIKAAKEEIENCNNLKAELAVLSEYAINCATQLESIHSSLSQGLSANGITENINGILERAACIRNLQLSANQASANADLRIKQLEEDISSWEAEKENLSRKWWEWYKKENSSEETEAE